MFTEEHEDSLQDIIGEYDNEVFWEALAYRMAKRDVIEQIGPTKEIKMKFLCKFFIEKWIIYESLRQMELNE